MRQTRFVLRWYATVPDKNPKGPENGTQRGFRGGGWVDSTPIELYLS
jgi:hypothetical protein